MPFFGELAALGTSLCWSGGSTLFAYAGRRIGSYNVNKLRLLMAAFYLCLFLLLRFGKLFPTGLSGHALFYLSLSGIIGLSLGDTFYFRSLVILGARKGALLGSLAPVMTVAIAFIMIGERLSFMAMSGVLVTLAGVSWVTTETKDEKLDHREGSKLTGVLMGVAAAAGQALGLVLAKEGMGASFEPMSATFIRMLSASVALWLVAAARKEIAITFKTLADTKAARALLGAAFLGPTIGVWLSLVAVQNTQAGIAAAIMGTYPVIIIPLTMIVHKDRPTYRSVLGTIIAVAGVAMLFLK